MFDILELRPFTTRIQLQLTMQDVTNRHSQVVRSATEERRDESSSDTSAAESLIPVPFKPRPPLTPAGRTGVPRSLTQISPFSRQHSDHVEYNLPPNDIRSEDLRQAPYEQDLYYNPSEFRNALDHAIPEQREKEREAMEKKERSKRRETWLNNESWNPRKWLHGFDESSSSGEERQYSRVASSASPQVSLPRAESHPQIKKRPTAGGTASMRWSRLKSLLPQLSGTAHDPGSVPASSAAGTTVNITDELITGGLSGLILRMWFERDERGARRIPVLLHRLRIRVSDSLHPLHGTKAVFRIEVCVTLRAYI